MLDEKTFISWIEEYMYFKADRNKVYIINDIIKQWAMDNPDMTDDEFADLYGIDQSATDIPNEPMDFAQVTYGQTFNPMGSPYNPYSQGGLTYSAIIGMR
jgi:hypothetical protein